jgi:hypothetical protein
VPPPPPDPETARWHLLTLANRLLARGFYARLVTPTGRPAFVRVVSPTASDLAEDVGCGQAQGELSFLWSWQDSIAPVRQVDAAVERVTYVLTPQSEWSS